jgi:hypothetical protein
MRWLQFLVIVLAFAWLATPVRADNTVQDFASDFEGRDLGPDLLTQAGAAAGQVPPEIISGWTGHALQLTQELNGQDNGAAFNQVVWKPYEKLQIDFEMQFSYFPNPAAEGADGIGMLYANSAVFGAGNDSPVPVFVGEEPSLPESLGIAFDIYNNGGPDEGAQNSVSLHYDRVRIATASLDTSDILSLELGTPMLASIEIEPSGTGSNVSVALIDIDADEIAIPFEDVFIEGLQPYGGRMVFRGRTGGLNSEQVIDNIAVTGTPIGGGDPETFFEDFESYPLGEVIVPPRTDPVLPPLVGGTPFTSFRVDTASQPGVKIISSGEEAGIQPGYLQLTETVGNQSNSIAFDQTSDVADNIQASFKFRIQNSFNNADGMSFLILDSDVYGDTGPLEAGFSEDPNLANALGIGIDIYDNDEEREPSYVDVADPTGCAPLGNAVGTCLDRRANHISVHWNGARVGKAARLDLADLDLANGQWNDVMVSATEAEDGMNVTVTIIDGADGSVHKPIDNLFVPGVVFPNGARAAFGGRTGGAWSNQSIDDVSISWIAGLLGDYNHNDQLDAGDLNLQASVGIATQDLAYDLNGDGKVDFEGDRIIWLHDLKKVPVGDADLNGSFTSDDFVTVFTGGLYETGLPATWGTGDWDGDLVFDSNDFVAAFIDGYYEQEDPFGSAGGAAAVPEPTSVMLLLLGLFGCLDAVRRH